jgi:hypothetical protein
VCDGSLSGGISICPDDPADFRVVENSREAAGQFPCLEERCPVDAVGELGGRIKQRYQAEALVHKHLPVDALSGFVYYNDDALKTLTGALAKRKQTMKVVKKPDWYF